MNTYHRAFSSAEGALEADFRVDDATGDTTAVVLWVHKGDGEYEAMPILYPDEAAGLYAALGTFLFPEDDDEFLLDEIIDDQIKAASDSCFRAFLEDLSFSVYRRGLDLEDHFQIIKERLDQHYDLKALRSQTGSIYGVDPELGIEGPVLRITPNPGTVDPRARCAFRGTWIALEVFDAGVLTGGVERTG